MLIIYRLSAIKFFTMSWCLSLFSVLASLSHVGAAAVCSIPETPLFQALRSLPSLVQQESCRNALQHYVSGLANCTKESLQMYDASTKYPDGLLITNGYYLGHFDLCVATETSAFMGKYCLVHIQVINKHLDQKRHRFKLNRDKFHVALCIPSTCEAEDIELALRGLRQPYSLFPISQYSENIIHISRKSCTTLDAKNHKANSSASKTIWMYAITIYFLMLAVSCLYEPPKSHESQLGVKGCFSLSRHWRRLVNPSPALPDSISCINGLRVLGLSMVILGHRTEAIASGPLLNPDFLEKLFENAFINILLLNGSVIVDVFFTISGLLTCRKILQTLELGERPSYLGVFCRRYLRIAPTYAIAIVLQAYFAEDLGTGPLWGVKVGQEAENCRINWWTNLLFINNYWDPQHICMDPSWYLACDMQLLVMGLLIIHCTTQWRQMRLVPFAAAFFASFWIPFMVTYFHGLDPTVIPDPETVGKTCENSTNLLLYITAYCRSGPYLAGMAAAFILQALKKNETEQSEKFWRLGWYSAWVCIFGSIVVGYPFFTTRQLHPLWASFYAGSFRTIFSIGVAFGIIACSQGKGGWVNEILSAPPFLILSRISYSAYLSHTIWLQLSYSWIRSPLYATDLLQAYLIMSDLLLSGVVGLIFYLTVEGPITDLTHIFLCSSRNKTKIK